MTDLLHKGDRCRRLVVAGIPVQPHNFRGIIEYGDAFDFTKDGGSDDTSGGDANSE